MQQPCSCQDATRKNDLVRFRVCVEQTDLFIYAVTELRRKAYTSVRKQRDALVTYARRHPLFLTSLDPCPVDSEAPYIVKQMGAAAQTANVGPMAAVAGAIAESVGQDLLSYSPDVIVENGGDIFLKTSRKRVVGIYAGTSCLSGCIGIEVAPRDTPLGVCTSSGTFGHSLSLGEADAVVAISPSAALADAAATALANRVRESDDVAQTAELMDSIEGLRGVVVIKGDRIAAKGAVKLATLRGV